MWAQPCELHLHLGFIVFGLKITSCSSIFHVSWYSASNMVKTFTHLIFRDGRVWIAVSVMNVFTFVADIQIFGVSRYSALNIVVVEIETFGRFFARDDTPDMASAQVQKTRQHSQLLVTRPHYAALNTTEQPQTTHKIPGSPTQRKNWRPQKQRLSGTKYAHLFWTEIPYRTLWTWGCISPRRQWGSDLPSTSIGHRCLFSVVIRHLSLNTETVSNQSIDCKHELNAQPK